MSKAKLLMLILIVAFGLMLSSHAMASNMELMITDVFTWRSLYDDDYEVDRFVPINGGNPYDPSSVTQTLFPGVYQPPDGTEDAFGVAQIHSIIDSDTRTPLWDRSATQELTVFFWGADDVYLSFQSPENTTLLSTGFRAEVWLDNSPDFDVSQGPDGRNDPLDKKYYNTATDGTLVLALEGHTRFFSGNQPFQVWAFGDPSTGNFVGNVFLDVVGGLWASAYDTNTFAPPGSDTKADMMMGFFSLNISDEFGWTTRGHSYVQANVVPEPATIGLMGVGLLSIALVGRKRIPK